jgi:hypothetical protein
MSQRGSRAVKTNMNVTLQLVTSTWMDPQRLGRNDLWMTLRRIKTPCPPYPKTSD